MGTSRYPRRGHRLAPAALGELLRQPVAYLPSEPTPSRELLLCDLDESVWNQFEEATCRRWADEVVYAVGRAARRPMSIGDRTIPRFPPGFRLTDLELETRTLNCLVAAGIHQRPQDLAAMSIEGILGLPGFWVKCLIDLLTSLEYAAAHPEARRSLRNRRGATIVPAIRAVSRFPRAGFRLAPAMLQEVLLEPLAHEFVAQTPLEGKRLCDLDESVWGILDTHRIEQLAEVIVSRVTAFGSHRTIRQRRLPQLPKGVRLDDLHLENRTFNCLRRAGLTKRPDDLAKQTIGGLLEIKAFGAKCLVDLLSSLETLQTRESQGNEDVVAEIQALADLPEASAIHFSDPRLGPLLRQIDAEANTIGELVQHVRRHRLSPRHPLRVLEAVREARRQVERLPRLSLEEELMAILAPSDSSRDTQIVREYYGWDGEGRRTLEELGQKYSLSRERIRQVCVRAVKRCRGRQVFAPVLDRALAFLRQRLPCEASQLQAQFDAAGFSRRGLTLEMVQQAAECLDRPRPFSLVVLENRSLAVSVEQAEIPRAILQAARRSVLGYGAATLGDVAAELAPQFKEVAPALIRETLKTLPDFGWLDENRGWFQLESLPQYGLPNMIEKVLSVAPRIDVGKLRAAIARYRRSGRSVPPTGVLLEFCRRLPGVLVEGHHVVAHPPRAWQAVLSGVEASMVRVLHACGPVLERSEFEEHCLDAGMNRFSFNAIVMCSPVITQYGRGVYGLIGAKVDRRTIQKLAARRTIELPVRVLRGFGQTEDGQVYLAYRLSKAAISGGVITVPAAMKEMVQGSFLIRGPEGAPVGTLVSKSGCAWGLGPALRSCQAQPGDQLLLLFDPGRREAELHLGEDALLEAVLSQKECVGAASESS